MSDENGAKPQKKRGGDRLMKSEKREKRPKVQRTGRELILHRVYVALTAVSAVIVALFVLYNILVVKPTVGGRTEKDPAAPGATEDVTQAPNHVKGDDGDRKEDFNLMEACLTDEEAAQECSRCLRCDHYGYGAFRGGRKDRW